MRLYTVNKVTCEHPSYIDNSKRVVTATFYERVIDCDSTYYIEKVAVFYNDDGEIEAQEREFFKFDDLDTANQKWLKLLSCEINVHGIPEFTC